MKDGWDSISGEGWDVPLEGFGLIEGYGLGIDLNPIRL